MHLVAQPDATLRRSRTSAYPAPLCQACNIPMALNGEYGPALDGSQSTRREYQCRLCGTGTMIRRTRHHRD